ncbi:MAG: dihydrofolate reductase [Salinivirgaceae bacterium]|jgi:dihydrofolate reductase|nr:dihydrofolate reductase [Salinivirgaceae bacterium]
MSKILSIIVAVAEDNGIGNENKLLTHISDDLKRFKKITKGHTVVMGRNTWFSLPNRPLPYRPNIVITNNPDEKFEGATTVYSIDEAITQCPENEESFIIGGAMVYQQFFPKADKLYLTKIHKTFPTDTFFPEVLQSEWKVLKEEHINDDEKAGLNYSFIDLERI